MHVYAKDFLYPGKWRLPDGRVEDFTPERVSHLAARASDMLRAGLPIPLAWEHQPKAVPLSTEQMAEELKQKTRKVLGYATESTLKDGIGVGKFEVPDPDDARKVPANRYVSPRIVEDFIDGQNRLWPGESIVHFALTPRPVQHIQKPFVQLSLGEQERVMEEGIDLSFNDPVVDLGENPFAKEKKPESEESTEKPAEEKSEMPEKKPESDKPPQVDSAKYSECKRLLAEHGVRLPADTTEQNFVEHLTVALTALQGMLTPKEEGNPQPDQQQRPSDRPQEVQMPMQMSQEEAVSRLEKFQKHAYATGREKIKARIQACLDNGQIDQRDAADLLKRLGTVSLSLSDDLEVDAGPVSIELSVWEKNKKGTYGTPKTRGREVPLPGGDGNLNKLREQAKEDAKKVSVA